MIFYAFALLALVWAAVISMIAVSQDDLLVLACGLLALAGSACVLHFGEAK